MDNATGLIGSIEWMRNNAKASQAYPSPFAFNPHKFYIERRGNKSTC